MKSEKEFNLGNYLEQSNATYLDSYKIKVKYVKEFIKRLKEFRDKKLVKNNHAYNLALNQMIDEVEKLAGEKLK